MKRDNDKGVRRRQMMPIEELRIVKQRIKIVTNRAGLIETIILCPVSEDEERTKVSDPDKPQAFGAFQRKPDAPKARGK